MKQKRQFIIFSLEPIPSRYTLEWITHLPKMFTEKLGDKFHVIQLDGVTLSKGPTPGGFLNFAATNLWKNEQMNKFFHMFQKGEILDDAIILFTDAWNPTILEVKYTKDLLKKGWTIMSFWHAGSYIDSDPLGQLIEDKRWSYAAEESFFNACDLNVFATMDHLIHFSGVFDADPSKILRSGFPMEYIQEIDFPKVEKTDSVVFAARNSPEKQPDIFAEMAKKRPQYKFINCQEQNMTKQQYHKSLAQSKVTLSFALLETLGIVQHEALQAGSIPLSPNHLCYTEEYTPGCEFLYNDKYIKSEKDVDYLCNMLDFFMVNYEGYLPEIKEQLAFQRENFFSCNILIDYIKNSFRG